MREVGSEAARLLRQRRQVPRLVARRRHQRALQLRRRAVRAGARALQRRAGAGRALLLLFGRWIRYNKVWNKTKTYCVDRIVVGFVSKQEYCRELKGAHDVEKSYTFRRDSEKETAESRSSRIVA